MTALAENQPLLLIEDDKIDAMLVRRQLSKEGWDVPVHHVYSLEEAQGWLSEHTPALILSDLNLEDSCGLETVARLRQLSPDHALVVLTGVSDEEVGVQAVRAGAQEYLLKGQLEGQLKRTLRYAMERMRSERALKASQRALVEASKQEAIGRLAAKIAHDLNNMLTLILPCADLLKGRLQGDTEALQDVTLITEAARRSQRLVQGLLAFGRKQMLRPAPMDLCQLIERFQPLLERTVGESFQVQARLDPATPPILFDASQMELILVNLAANAREAVKPGGGRVTITVRRAGEARPSGVPEGEFAQLIFEDDGQGISPEALPRLFEPFFTTRPASGNSVGLASVYGVVRQSNGHIHVESEHGRWTRFTLFLPFAPVEKRIPEQPSTTSSMEGAPGGRERILVVEDEPGVRDIVVRTLKRMGYQVLEADSGPAALSVAEAFGGPIDLMLSDVVMPNTNTGAFVAEMVRRRPELKVVLMSGYAADETIRHGVEVGKYPFLQKPFTPGALLRQLRLAFDELI